MEPIEEDKDDGGMVFDDGRSDMQDAVIEQRTKSVAQLVKFF